MYPMRSETKEAWDSKSEIRMHTVRASLLKAEERDTEAFQLNLSLVRFKERFASDNDKRGNAFEGAEELEPGHYEWQRLLLLPERRQRVPLLCCPEDAERSKSCRHADHELCGSCKIPLCGHCLAILLGSRGARRVIPRGLCNDNFWGYTTSIIARYGVRWIEAAIVSPCWTSMMCYYVEGDRGHLMNEEVGQQKFRTMVRGSCCSFQMPWNDILRELQRNCLEGPLTEIPRPEETLKYVLKVHVNVGGFDLKKHLKQVCVRPHVLLLLLEFLIDRKHESEAKHQT